ncbi:murein hydrolase activator EnvC family protein [Sulfurospirillum sp. 1307]
MRILLVFAFLHVALFGATSTYDKKIVASKNELKTKSTLERKISRRLKDIAKDITTEQKRLNKIKNEIESLSKNIASSENVVNAKETNLVYLTKQNLELINKKKELEEKIVKLIAEDFSFYIISDKDYIDSKESIIADEVIDKIGVIVKKEISNLTYEYEKINKRIELQSSQIKNIKKEIEDLKKKKSKLSSLKKSKEKSIKKLAIQKKEYKNRLYKIEKERDSLRATLNKLKILKEKESEAERKKRLADLKEATKDININDKMTVRQIGSSYQRSRIKKYRGAKTIAPLDSFIVKRKFGSYVDPIYKIKIFNEAVILQSKQKNAKVKNVLDGKVVYAKNTAVLDNVVIVENSRGIHTIYAHLNKIAPTIKVGKKIRKGYVIGRVDEELSFEVTQKSYHINPLELIRY